MKNVFLVFLSIAGILYLESCSNIYKIKGEIDVYGYEGARLNLISFVNGSFDFLDSCDVYHGKFQMEGEVEDVTFAILCRDKEPILPLYLEKGNIEIKMKPTQHDVSGTEQNNLLYDFLLDKRAIDNLYEERVQRKMTLISEGLFNKDELEKLDKSIEEVCMDMENLMYNFITKNFNQKVSVGVFSMLCNSSEKEITPLIKRILDNAPSDFLNSPYVERYLQQVGYTPN